MILLVLALLVLEAAAAAIIWRCWRVQGQVQAQAHRLAAVLAEIERLAQARVRLREKQRKFEQSLDATTDSVENVHRALADLSFNLWGHGDAAAYARHHQRAEKVYGGVRTANRLLGKWTGKWLDGNSRNDEDKGR